MITNDEQHRKDCLRRHYEDMDKVRALDLMGELGKKAKAIFVKRINYAKGYKFI
jgi:hypothetical protein